MRRSKAGRFLECAALEKWGIVFTLGITTGMRPSEILGLQWKEVDLKAGRVTVQRALTYGKAGRQLDEPKSDSGRRSIPLPASMPQALREHRAHQAEERLAAGEAYANNDFVFANPGGLPLSSRTLTEHFKRILKAAGLPDSIRWYDLRTRSGPPRMTRWAEVKDVA